MGLIDKEQLNLKISEYVASGKQDVAEEMLNNHMYYAIEQQDIALYKAINDIRRNM